MTTVDKVDYPRLTEVFSYDNKYINLETICNNGTLTCDLASYKKSFKSTTGLDFFIDSKIKNIEINGVKLFHDEYNYDNNCLVLLNSIE